MHEDTVIVYTKGGTFSNLETTNSTVHRVAVVEQGSPFRMTAVRRLVLEADITRGVETIRACDRAGAWNALSDWADLAAYTLKPAAEACTRLASLCLELRNRHPSDPAALLADTLAECPEIDAAKHLLRDALHVLERLPEVTGEVEQVVADWQDSTAADGGPHQGRRSLIACVSC